MTTEQKSLSALLREYAGLLALYAGIAGLILAVVFQVTEPLKRANALKQEIAARSEVLPGAVDFQERQVNNQVYYIGYDAHKKIIGYVGKASRRGYGSAIQTLIGVNQKFEIVGMKILAQAETPGLGTKVAEQGFLRQFFGKNEKQLHVQKDGGEIVAITGATISSRAVAESVREEIMTMQSVVQNNERSKRKHG